MNHDENDDVFNRTDCMPALFPAADAFHERDAMRIVEDGSCSFEINAMLCLVAPVLRFMPVIRQNPIQLSCDRFCRIRDSPREAVEQSVATPFEQEVNGVDRLIYMKSSQPAATEPRTESAH